jgi:hypothetical protein
MTGCDIIGWKAAGWKAAGWKQRLRRRREGSSHNLISRYDGRKFVLDDLIAGHKDAWTLAAVHLVHSARLAAVDLASFAIDEHDQRPASALGPLVGSAVVTDAIGAANAWRAIARHGRWSLGRSDRRRCLWWPSLHDQGQQKENQKGTNH